MRWGDVSLGVVRAGTLSHPIVELENAGSVTWHPAGPNWIYASYHWLDRLGNPILWDGLRTPLPHPVPPGRRIRLELALRAPIPPGRYRLALDLEDAERLWFSEIGNPPLERDVDVAPRIAERRLAVRISPGEPGPGAETKRALAGQEEPLVADERDAVAVAHLAPGCLPAADWSRRILDAHAEGYAAVSGSVKAQTGLFGRRSASTLAAWAPGGGRNPAFAHPLLCPSLLRGVEPDWAPEIEGLPALRPPADEPWLYDGRITLTARLRSDRRRG